MDPTAAARKERRLPCAVGAMLVVGPSNYVLYKVLFAAYGLDSAIFVMQCVNMLYVVYGHFALMVAERRGEVTDAMRRSSRFPFVVRGVERMPRRAPRLPRFERMLLASQTRWYALLDARRDEC